MAENSKRRGRPKIERIDARKFLDDNPATANKLAKLSTDYTQNVQTVMDEAKIDAKVIISFQFIPRK